MRHLRHSHRAYVTTSATKGLNLTVCHECGQLATARDTYLTRALPSFQRLNKMGEEGIEQTAFMVAGMRRREGDDGAAECGLVWGTTNSLAPSTRREQGSAPLDCGPTREVGRRV